MSEDRFFQNIRSAMVEYSPEVPHAVYTGMRKKLWWSNFTRISATRFNIWYAALILISGALVIGFNSKDASSVLENPRVVQSEISTAVSQDKVTSQDGDISAQTNENRNEEASPKPVMKTTTPSAVKDEKPADVANAGYEKEVVAEQNSTTELPKDAKKDSSTTPAKSLKKGMKVKTFQVTDK